MQAEQKNQDKSTSSTEVNVLEPDQTLQSVSVSLPVPVPVPALVPVSVPEAPSGSAITRTRIAIIGSGPAGYSAALYAARSGYIPLVFEGDQPGGQLITTNKVENYLGFHAIDGYDLTQQFKSHVEEYHVQVIPETIVSIERGPIPKPSSVPWIPTLNRFLLGTSSGQSYAAETVIVATGATAKRLGLPNEHHFWTKGISACAVCDGALPMFRGQRIAVVGGGDTAMEEALHLSNFASVVYLIHRSGQFRASDIMLSRVSHTRNIEVVTFHIVVDCFGSSSVDAEYVQKFRTWDKLPLEMDPTSQCLQCILIKDTLSGQESILPVKGLFYAVGHVPNSGFIRTSESIHLDMDKDGYIDTIPGSTRTNVPGLFACGDVQDRVYRQAITAAASGCMAALDAGRYLFESLRVNSSPSRTES